MAAEGSRSKRPFRRLVVGGTLVLFVVLMLLNIGASLEPDVFGSRAFAGVRLVVGACFTVGLVLCVGLWLLRIVRRH